jgi:L-gulonolactone oxidase
MERWANWARNQECRPATIERPRSDLEVVEAVKRATAMGQRVKVFGAGHSFTDAACTDGRLLSLELLNRVINVDEEAGTVTVEAGMTIRRLNHELAERGLALENLGDIDKQSVAGAISTGTHGTGAKFGGLATFVEGLEIVTADGEIVRCSTAEEPEVLHCARVSVGALGVITKATLRCVPAFTLHHIERPRRFDDVLAGLDDDIANNDYFEFYWLPHTDSCAVIANNRTDQPVEEKSAYKRWRAEVFFPNFFFGTLVGAGKLMPKRIPRFAKVVADSLGRTELVNRSDRIFISTRLIRFVEMEFSIPRDQVASAVRAVRKLIEDEGLLVSFPIEVRFVKGDDIPLSMAHGRDSCFIAVHMARGAAFEPYFRGVEQIMTGLGGRPHWGKMHFRTAADLAPAYPEWERFAACRARLDPEGRFANDYLDRVLGPAGHKASI